MAAAPPLPIAATVAVSGYTLHTSWSTGLTGHSDPQIPQERRVLRKDKGKDKQTVLLTARKKDKRKVHPRAGLGPPPLRSPPPCPLEEPFLCRRNPPSWCARTPKPRPSPFPPTSVSPTGPSAYPTPRPPRHPSQPPRLRSPGRAPREEVVPRLGFSAGAPPALCRVCPAESSTMGSRLRMAGQQLVVSSGEGLLDPPQLGASDALPRRRPIASLGSHVLPDPLLLRLGSNLRCDPRHMGQGHLPSIPLW